VGPVDQARLEVKLPAGAQHGLRRESVDVDPDASGLVGSRALHGQRGRLCGLARHLALVVDAAPLAPGGLAGEEPVHGLGGVLVHHHLAAPHHLHHHVEGGRRAPLADGLGRAAAAGLVVAEGDHGHAAHHVAEHGVQDEVLERVAVGGGDELYAPLGDGARRRRLGLGADLIDDDDLGHVVLHRLDHHGVLPLGPRHLHAPGRADGRMRHVAIAADLVGGVDDHDALIALVGEHARDLAQLRGLADTRGLDGAEEGAAHAEGEAHHVAAPVSQGRDAVQGALDARAVLGRELAHGGHHGLQLGGGDGLVRESLDALYEAGLGGTAEVEHDLEEIASGERAHASPQRLGQGGQEQVEVVVLGDGHSLLVATRRRSLKRGAGSGGVALHRRARRKTSRAQALCRGGALDALRPVRGSPRRGRRRPWQPALHQTLPPWPRTTCTSAAP
jgi:hypothetical protein